MGGPRASVDLQGGSHSVSQVDGVSDMASACLLCGGRAQPRDNGLCSPWCQTLQSLPVRHWCLSSCYPGSGAQREWVWLGESVCGLFKRYCLGSRSSFHQLNLHWFLQPEVKGIYLPGTRILDWVAWFRSGTPHSQDIPPEFLSTWVWGQPAPLLLVWMDVVSSIPLLSDFHSTQFCGCHTSFNLISDVPKWWWFYILAVILMCLCKKASHVCLHCHLD